MRVEWYRSATVGIFTDSGQSVLCDPWVFDGAFIGSWYHFPALEGFESQELLSRRWDFVYISHLHADHFDRKFLALLARNQPDCVALVPDFAHAWLSRAVERCGFGSSRVIRVPNNSPMILGELQVKILTADYCHPETCGVSTPCFSSRGRARAIDSLALFQADGQTVLNANDALAVASVDRLWQHVGEVDVLLGHYGGAGPYPQCFTDYSNEKKTQEAKKLAEVFVRRLARAAEVTRARHVMPYAGQYVLGGSLAPLNPYRSVVNIDEATKLLSAWTDAQVLSMQPFSGFQVGDGSAEHPWIEPDEINTLHYLNRISKKEFPYEVSSNGLTGLQSILDVALEKMAREYEQVAAEQRVNNYSLILQADDFFRQVVFEKDKCFGIDSVVPSTECWTRISLHPNLLRNLITRRPGYRGFTQYHWNQAEIGSHLSWSRAGNYEPLVSSLLNHFHA